MTIRKAIKEDLPAIKELFRETVIHTCKYDYSPKQIEVWSSSADDHALWERRVAEQYFLVAEIDDKIVGFASLDKDGCIDLLYVHKDYVKKRVASYLFDEIEKEIMHLKIPIAYADVSLTAMPFFERKGFVAEKENRFVLKEVKIVNWRMVKCYT